MSSASVSSDDDVSSDVPMPPLSPQPSPSTNSAKNKKSKRQPGTASSTIKQKKKRPTKGKIITQRGKGFNSWREAVKILNKDSTDFSIPRKGSKRYEEAKKLSAKLKKQHIKKMSPTKTTEIEE